METENAKKETAARGTKHKKLSFWGIVGKVILVLFLLSIFFTIIYRWINPPFTPLMVIRSVGKGYPIEKEWVPLEEMSRYMPASAIASEDCYFLGHHGFDAVALNTVINERVDGVRKRGGSTISQQTAKNVFLWPRGSWLRKGCEAYFTVLIETFWPKERIMEVYLNVIEMGPGIYGAEAAAQHYFHCHASELSARQAALITACYPSPLKRDAAHPTRYVSNYASMVQGKVARNGRVHFDKASIAHMQKRYQQAVVKMKKRNARKRKY